MSLASTSKGVNGEARKDHHFLKKTLKDLLNPIVKSPDWLPMASDSEDMVDGVENLLRKVMIEEIRLKLK